MEANEAVGLIGDVPLREIAKKCSSFRDGRKIDFILAYTPPNGKNPANDQQNQLRREIFENNLLEEGLILEKDESSSRVHFVKIHVPFDVLTRYAEIMKIKMPIKKIHGQEFILEGKDIIDDVKNHIEDFLGFLKADPGYFPEKKYQLTAEFSRDKEYLFDIADPNFFPESVRISVANFILERKRYNNDHEAVYDVGIDSLIAKNVYRAAYPLHDGDCDENGNRKILLDHWAQIKHWIKYQPVDTIRDYFGEKIAIYFAWLGFYTHMLIPASIVGLICFIYGLATLGSNTLSNDICNSNLSITMCPLCDANCDFWRLEDTCTEARLSYLFDNNFTIIFAIFMSFWSTLYLEMWKRYSANMTHRWGLTGFDHQAEHPRPQFLAKFDKCKKRKNVVTHILEPVVPFWRVRLPYTILSFSLVLFMIAIVCAAVFGVVLYRMSQLASDSLVGSSPNSAILMPCSAAFINLVLITLLNYTYDKVAVYLTDMEYLRTQTEYDESLTLKIYLFQFVNYYSSIFYIAFLKGKFVGYPMKYNRILGYRQEECGPGGCFVELFIQLAIIMIGRQAISSIIEILIPFLNKWFQTILETIGVSDVKESDSEGNLKTDNQFNQWNNDLQLLPWGSRGLFDEYLEMILQYGFVTLFVSAFPLAPFFALINNIFEMRLDAKKFLKYYQRPVPRRVRNIGVWYNIMDILGRLAVISNAFMIAFSSTFIPRLVYMMTVSADNTDEGFLQHSLSYFDTRDFQVAQRATAFTNVTICRYAEYRNPPDHERKYKRPEIYWHIMMARFAFIVVFQNVVNFVRVVVEWAIPDVPRKLHDQIKREAYLTNEIIIMEEARRSRQKSDPQSVLAPVSFSNDDTLQHCPHCNTADHSEHEHDKMTKNENITNETVL